MNYLFCSGFRGHGNRLVFLFTCLITLWSGPVLTAANAGTPSKAQEHEIKAAMLFKFLGYVDWPETRFSQPSEPYRIWVLGAPQIEQELREIVSNRTSNDRAVEIRKAQRLDQINDAHMVFVGQAAKGHLPALARQARKNGFMVVTENDEGLPPGSTINLRIIDDRVGFDVSLASAQNQQLRLSARLLSVAAFVEKEAP